MTLHRVSPGADGPPPVASGYVFGTPAEVSPTWQSILDDTFTTSGISTGRVPDVVGVGTWTVDDSDIILAIAGGAVENTLADSPGEVPTAAGAAYAFPAAYTDWRADVFLLAPMQSDPAIDGASGSDLLAVSLFGVATESTFTWRYQGSSPSFSTDSIAFVLGGAPEGSPVAPPMQGVSSATSVRVSVVGTATSTTYSVAQSIDGVTYTDLATETVAGAAISASSIEWYLTGKPGNVNDGALNPLKITRILFSATA